MAHVLLTGISGFLAGRIAQDLLAAGHRVRGSVRNSDAEARIRTSLSDGGDRLEIVTLDLTRDDGWSDAAQGVDAIIHTASPFPINQTPPDPQTVIGPAVAGVERACRAARTAGVERIILTSSSVAVMNGPRPAGRPRDERDWSTEDHPNANAYVQSKTLAERAAWEEADTHGLALTTLNPGLILGPPLAGAHSTSLQVVERVLSGKDPMLPPLKFEAVDVRDVSRAHIAALNDPTTAGERFILAAGGLWMSDIARIARSEAPGRRIAKRVAPAIAIKGLALMDPTLRGIVPILGRDEPISGNKARERLGIDYIPAEDAARASIKAFL